jgi:hypothetical protein
MYPNACKLCFFRPKEISLINFNASPRYGMTSSVIPSYATPPRHVSVPTRFSYSCVLLFPISPCSARACRVLLFPISPNPLFPNAQTLKDPYPSTQSTFSCTYACSHICISAALSASTRSCKIYTWKIVYEQARYLHEYGKPPFRKPVTNVCMCVYACVCM